MGFKWAPETEPSARMMATRAAPVAVAFSSSSRPVSPGLRFWAAMPEPITAINGTLLARERILLGHAGGLAMTERRPCRPAPGPLEAYAGQFDPLFGTLAQRRNFREDLQGLLLPRDRNKTLSALAGAEPIVEAQAGAVQRLQVFLSESPWDAEAVNASRLALLLGDPATAPHANGVLVIDDTGDRKAGSHTAHVARQWLGSIGKVDNGIVAVSSLWADERVYYPLHVRPYTPAGRLPKGKQDPAFQTKPQLALELVAAAR